MILGDIAQGRTRHIVPNVAIRTGCARVNLVEACHVVDIVHRKTQGVGCGVSTEIDTLDAVDAAVFFQTHATTVADGGQVQIGAARQAQGVKATAATHHSLGSLARGVVGEVGHVAGRQFNGVVTLACKETVHTTATRQGVSGGRADDGFGPRTARDCASAGHGRRHPLRAAEDETVTIAQ